MEMNFCASSPDHFTGRNPGQNLIRNVLCQRPYEKRSETVNPAEHAERALFIVEGSLTVLPDARNFITGQLLILKPNEEIVLSAVTIVRLILLGSESMDSQRYIWWNFVSSSQERIEQAKEDWKSGKFAPVPEET